MTDILSCADRRLILKWLEIGMKYACAEHPEYASGFNQAIDTAKNLFPMGGEELTVTEPEHSCITCRKAVNIGREKLSLYCEDLHCTTYIDCGGCSNYMPDQQHIYKKNERKETKQCPSNSNKQTNLWTRFTRFFTRSASATQNESQQVKF